MRCIRDTYNKTHRSGLCAWNALEPVRAVTSWSRVCADQRIYRDNLWCLMVVDDFEWFFKGFLGFHHKKKRKSFKKWWLARGWLVPLVEDFVHNWLNAETTGFDRELRIDSQDESGSVVFIKVLTFWYIIAMEHDKFVDALPVKHSHSSRDLGHMPFGKAYEQWKETFDLRCWVGLGVTWLKQ